VTHTTFSFSSQYKKNMQYLKTYDNLCIVKQLPIVKIHLITNLCNFVHYRTEKLAFGIYHFCQLTAHVCTK